MNILETCMVSKTYQVQNSTIKAVDEVSLSIKAGEFVALVGPSGSGKTTMLAMLAGLLTPSGGSIVINGQPLERMSDSQRTRFRRQNIGFTFQSSNLVPYLSVLENVELMLKVNGRDGRQERQQARDLLVKLGLGDRLNSKPSQLSGGQQQRVAIARSIIHNPDIVLADEPTASLDTERAIQVVSVFAELIHARRLAGVMVTHDLRMCRYVDRVIQMQDGRIRQVLSSRAEIDALAATAD
ncbi:MAG: ABC transporter ATP-binding protein [Chloroflexi bacterium]|nr:MAG: ABC transporter ATP-binding protein [Chloroflexota bacterium]